MGFRVVILDPNASITDRKIVDWTRVHGTNPNDEDNKVAVDFNVGGYVRFSNSLFLGQPNTTAVYMHTAWDPPGDPRPSRGPSQHTYFDNQPLSTRDQGYQETAVNFFGDYVLASYFRTRTYVVDPTAEVVEQFGGRPPTNVKEVEQLVTRNPKFLRYIHCVDSTFAPDEMSRPLRAAIHNLLGTEETLAEYLFETTTFLEKQPDLSERERSALQLAAIERPDMVRNAFECVALGRARGDGNVYLLIGVDRERNQPDPAGLDWALSQLKTFVTENGFLPGMGWFITEARQRHTVVAGPGVTQREVDFLAFFGHDLLDRRDGSTIGIIPTPVRQDDLT